jgi:serine protease Do
MKTLFKLGVAVLLVGLSARTAPAVANRRTPVVEVVSEVLPSVVNIGTEKIIKVRYTDPSRRVRGDLFDQFFSDYFGPPRKEGYRRSNSLGSGVIIDPRGYILTNFHVIERASVIRVTLSDDSKYEAVFLAGDEINDLALIKIEPLKPLRAVTFGEDDDLMLGETVIVLGNPFGLAQTVTMGVLSAKNREARYEGEILYNDILQTDAAVNPGSSGGPLVNIDGEVIGISVAIYREAQNIGFAVPIKRVKALLAHWMTPRIISKTWPGFDAEDTNGILTVISVDTNAVGASVRMGDIIKTVGGQPVSDLYDLSRVLLDYKVGNEIPLGIERSGVAAAVTAVMEALPKPSGEMLAKNLLGLEFASREDTVTTRFCVNKGLPIAVVVDGRGASKAGLRTGLFVTKINDYEITSLDDVGLALEKMQSGESVTLSLLAVEETGAFVVAQSSSVQVKLD